MGGFLGIGHSSAKTDRGNQLAGVQGNWNIYNTGFDVFNKQQNAGNATTATGLNTLNTSLQTLQDPLDYWKSILSGNRTDTAQVAQPAVRAATDLATAQRNQQAQLGTGRSGGTNAANQTIEQQQRANEYNAFFGVRPTAANQITQVGQAQSSVGQAQSQIGLDQLSKALQALGYSQGAINELINSSITSRGQSQKINQDTAGGIQGIAKNLIGVLGL